MQIVLENMKEILPVAIFFWSWLLLAVLWKPQRFRNSLLLMATVVVTMVLIAGCFGNNSGYVLMSIFLLSMLALLVVPVLLIINGIHMIRRESAALPNLLSLLLGIVVALGEIALCVSFFYVSDLAEATVFHKIMFLFGATVFYFSFLLLGFVQYTLFIQILPHRMCFDFVIIHGAGLQDGREVSKLLADRLDKAIELYERCKVKPILIPSGGQGDDEEISEADAMAGYLCRYGIPEEHIVREDQSTTTMENLINCKQIISARGGKRTALVSSNYHVYRCLSYARKLKMKCVGVGAHVAWYYWPSALIREFVAMFSKKKHLACILIGYVLLVFLPLILLFFR
ncbi:MAG: YdcF family protein [Eubacteriales bacterium]|nr:YdcF family protein [Eubacteriales bacterium]